MRRIAPLLALAAAILAIVACGARTDPVSTTTRGGPNDFSCHHGDRRLGEDSCSICTCSYGEWNCDDAGCCGPIFSFSDVVDPGQKPAPSDPAPCVPCTVGDTLTAFDGCNTCWCNSRFWECNVECAPCGAFAGCSAGRYCALEPSDVCGDINPSVCKLRPSDCPAVTEPVCGCDGLTHDNACEAARAGTGVRALGVCPDPIAFD